MNIKKLKFYLLIVAALLFIGFTRDYLFKSLNALLQAWDNEIDYSMPTQLAFFENLEYHTILKFKWFFTLLFTFIYFFISRITLNYMFNKKTYLQINFYCYFLLVLLSAITQFIGFLAPSLSENMYEFSRFLMGIAQSPLVLMVLIPTFIIFEKESEKSSSN